MIIRYLVGSIRAIFRLYLKLNLNNRYNYFARCSSDADFTKNGLGRGQFKSLEVIVPRHGLAWVLKE
jgi:hypothetical protein